MTNKNVLKRRESVRVPVAARVHYLKDGKNEILITKDMSEGGLFLKSDDPPYVGTQLALEISLPETEELLLIKGEVIWRRAEDGCGVRFLKVTAKNKKIIQEFLSKFPEFPPDKT